MKISTRFFFPLFLLLSMVFFSCDPDDGIIDCTKGTMRFTCTSFNPYRLYIDGSFETTIDGQTFYEVELLEGTHNYKMEQVSGYLLYPTIVNESSFIRGCKESEIIFP